MILGNFNTQHQCLLQFLESKIAFNCILRVSQIMDESQYICQYSFLILSKDECLSIFVNMVSSSFSAIRLWMLDFISWSLSTSIDDGDNGQELGCIFKKGRPLNQKPIFTSYEGVRPLLAGSALLFSELIWRIRPFQDLDNSVGNMSFQKMWLCFKPGKNSFTISKHINVRNR